MKSLALLPIAGALCLYGSAFFGVWTAPGLENLPTAAVVMEHVPWNSSAEPEPLTGIIPISSAQQFQPAGVTADWDDHTVIALPAPDPEKQIHVHPLPRIAATTPVRPKSRPVTTKPAAKVSQASRNRSYRGEGSKSTIRYYGSRSRTANRSGPSTGSSSGTRRVAGRSSRF